MTHQAAIALGLSLRILADTADDGAAIVAHDVVVGDYHSIDVLRAFAVGCDVVTWDHEHVPNEHIATLEAEGVVVRPGPAALQYAQDKAAMRRKLTELGIPCPRWAPRSPLNAELSSRSRPRSDGRWSSRQLEAGTTARASG